jgi:hypothetical protein
MLFTDYTKEDKTKEVRVCVGFEFLTDLTTKTSSFWNVKPRSLMKANRRSKGLYCSTVRVENKTSTAQKIDIFKGELLCGACNTHDRDVKCMHIRVKTLKKDIGILRADPKITERTSDLTAQDRVQRYFLIKSVINYPTR